MKSHSQKKFLGLGKILGALLLTTCLTSPALALTNSDARLILNRTGYAPTDAEVTAMMSYPDHPTAVNAVLSHLDFMTPTHTQAPVWASAATNPDPVCIMDEDHWCFKQQPILRAWWAANMVQTKSPMSERLVQFWHNHFTTQLHTIHNPWVMWNQDVKIRTYAVGDFSLLLNEMFHDPGILLFLNQPQSTRSSPSANYARELLEIYTVGQATALGDVNYSEDDVTALSVALTGMTWDPVKGVYAFNEKQHDPGVKTILGHKGAWGPEDIENFILEVRDPKTGNSVVAERVVSQLWQEFVSPTPNLAIVNGIAASFQTNWQILPVLRSLMLTNEFWGQGTNATLVKSPAEFVVGTVRQLGLQVNGSELVSLITAAGQTLYQPPNVRGDLTGINWINTAYTQARQGDAAALTTLYGSEVLHGNIPPLAPTQFAALSTKLLVDYPMFPAPTTSLNYVDALNYIYSDPTYWLK